MPILGGLSPTTNDNVLWALREGALSQHRIAGELGAVVRDDHAKLAAAIDQRRQFALPAVPGSVLAIAARHSRALSLTIFRTRGDQ
jgi:hypothetical protein